MPTDPAKISAEITEQYDVSSRWIQANYFGEWKELFRSTQCRTEPKLDKLGKEIKNRTNVSLPDHFVMRRKKVARLTANVPNLRVRAKDDQVRDKACATLYRQWDLGGWQRVLRQMIDQCAVLKWSVSKTSWNDAVVYRKLRKATTQLNRPQLMMMQGAPSDEILAAEQEDINLSDEETLGALQQFGPEVSLRLPIHKYEGPIGERVFVGDIFPEPGFKSLHQSAFVIEYNERDLPWLDYWAKVKGTHPDTGEYGPIFDEKIVNELRNDIENSANIPRRVIDLRRDLRDAIKQTDPTIQLDSRLRGPRFPIYERHSIMRDGRIRIDWCYDKDKLLGSMLYPWDTYGKYIYNELVLIPSLLGGIGESTIGASRYIKQLKDVNWNLVTDFMGRLLRPKMKRLDTCEVKEEDYEREGFSEMVVTSMDGMEPLNDPRFPGEAFLNSQVLTRELMQTEPLVNDFSPGTDANPNSGKLATTAIFQQRSSDSIVSDELKQLDCWLSDVLNLNLVMTQQAMQKKIEIASGVHERVDALSIMGGGEVRSITVDPLELQQDLEVFPETGSTLAADDEFKAQRIMQGYLMAKADPQNFNVAAFAKKLVSTIPGMTVDEAIMPPQPPPPPDVKVSLSISYKDLSPDAKVFFLQKVGAPVAGTQAQGAMESVVKMDEAAQAAANLEQPHVSESLAEQQKLAIDKKKVDNATKSVDKKVKGE